MSLPLLTVAHGNVNCSDLVRSRQFYEGRLGLQPSTHTNPEAQDGRGFGIAGPAAWDAWMLNDHRGPFTAPVVDLLQWRIPFPAGRPYSVAHHNGLIRLQFVVPSVADVAQRLTAGGIVRRTADALAVTDPDGTQLVCREGPVEAIEYRGMTVNCSDLARSSEWYEQVLGLEPSEHGGAPTGPLFARDEDAEVTAGHLALPGQGQVFTISLEEWSNPPNTGCGYPEANHLGIFRMAFMVADIDACYEQLLALGVTCRSAPVTLDMGPEVPVDGLRALCFADPDGACLELIETP